MRVRAALVVAAASLLLVTGVVPARGSGPMHPSAIVAPQAASRSDEGGSDFNGDGYADLAVSAELWPTTDEDDAFPGAVYVLYGSARGLTQAGRQRLLAADFTPGDTDETFGEVLTTGDFDGDGFADLAIGGSDLPYGPGGGTGRVWVVYGSPSGLSPARRQLWSQSTPGILGQPESDDGFGSVLVAADFGRGSQDDLAIGVGGEDGFRGAVAVIYGSSAGLTAAGNQLWTQASKGIPGKRQPHDNFGLSLAAGSFSGGPQADLAVGVPGDRVAGMEEAGSVNVLRGSPTGLTSAGARLWNQRTAGIKGSPQPMDGFGWSLATGHLAGRSNADLVIGAPGENAYRGAVAVIYGSARGLTAKGDQLWTRRTKGLGDRSRLDHDLGATMIVGSFGRDGRTRRYDDLVVRASDDKGVDLVEVIYGTARGLSPRHSRAWDLDSRGIKGKMSFNGTFFGSSLAAGRFGADAAGSGYDDLVIGDDFNDDGLFVVIHGSRTGLTARDDRLWTAPQFRVPGLRYLGRALAAG